MKELTRNRYFQSHDETLHFSSGTILETENCCFSSLPYLKGPNQPPQDVPRSHATSEPSAPAARQRRGTGDLLEDTLVDGTKEPSLKDVQRRRKGYACIQKHNKENERKR